MPSSDARPVPPPNASGDPDPQAAQVPDPTLQAIELEIKKAELTLRQHEVALTRRPLRSPQLWSPVLTACIGLLLGSLLTCNQKRQELANVETRLAVAQAELHRTTKERENAEKALTATRSELEQLRLEKDSLTRAKVDALKSAEHALQFETDCLEYLKDLTLRGRGSLPAFEPVFEATVARLRGRPLNDLSHTEQEIMMIDLYRKNEDEALIRHSETLDEGLTAVFALRLAAALQLDRGSPLVAEKTIRHALSRFPRSHQACKTLAAVLVAQDRYEEALAAIELALASRRSAEYIYTKGVILRYLGRVHEATEAFLEALHLDERHTAAYVELGRLYTEDGRLNEAIEVMGHGLSFDPLDPLLNTNAAWSCYLNGDMKKAEQHAKTAVAHMPTLGAPYHTLGLIALSRKDYTDAVRWLGKAVILAPGNAEIARDAERAKQLKAEHAE